MRARPRRPYRNFGLFCWANGASRIRPYPCLACKGRGLRNHPKYEDYEIVCTACGGTGKGTKEACCAAYLEAIETYKQDKAEYERLCYHRKEALKRLSKEEVKALQELGV